MPNATSVAVDRKGHVALVSPSVAGVTSVGFVIRHGDQIRLRVTDTTMTGRLEAAMNDGTCLEILYEDRQDGPFDGNLLHIC